MKRTNSGALAADCVCCKKPADSSSKFECCVTDIRKLRNGEIVGKFSDIIHTLKQIQNGEVSFLLAS